MSRAPRDETLSAIGEVVGAIAVLISLLYLALQIRQNTQARRFDLLMDASLGSTENIFLQYRLGFLPQSNQDRFAAILRAQFASEGVREFWRRRRSSFTAEFVAYVEGTLELYAPEPSVSA